MGEREEPMTKILRILALGLAVSASPALARDLPADPLKSVMWDEMAERFFTGGDIVFDTRVKVMVPKSAENQMAVPVTVDARELNGVAEIVVLADLNPIPQVLRMQPQQARPFIGFRMKVEQATPVRVGVRTVDGTWHLGGAWIDAAGGGCTAPANAHSVANWMKTLGETRAQVLREDVNTARVTVRMKHPMDTGLADGIPAFFMSDVNVQGEEGGAVAKIELFEPVSEDPTLTLLPLVSAAETRLAFNARDTEGNTYAYSLDVPAALSQ